MLLPKAVQGWAGGNFQWQVKLLDTEEKQFKKTPHNISPNKPKSINTTNCTLSPIHLATPLVCKAGPKWSSSSY